MTTPPPSRSRGEISWPYTLPELWADGLVHGIGMVLATLGALAFTMRLSSVELAPALSVGLYLTTLLVSTFVSAAYNMWPVSRTKWLLRRFDHAAIYLLIAGTYTPLLIRLQMFWLLAGVWSVALAGAGLKLLRPGEYDRVSIGLYLALGWSGAMAVDRLAHAFPASVLIFIGAGGIMYSSGVVFHLWEGLRFQNAIWHGFVVTAGSLHFTAIWKAVLVSL